MELAGPCWLDPIHNVSFVKEVLEGLDDFALETKERIKGMLTVISEEVPVPLYLSLPESAHVLRSSVPPQKLFMYIFCNHPSFPLGRPF